MVARTKQPSESAPLLPFRPGRGGARKGAGRRPKNGVAGVSHRERAALASRFPVHVTVKLRSGLRPLRRREEHRALRNAFHAGCAGVKRDGAFRLCHYAILNDHLHFVAEAHSREALSRGLQGLLVRIAKTLNKLWSHRGKVFADRYHDRILRTPREVRNAIRYVFQNAAKHAAEGRVLPAIDTYTSAPWF